jgi:acetyl-CoA synthetase
MLDYEQTRKDFTLDIPEHFNFGFDVVDRLAEDRTKLALVSVDPTGERAEKHTFWDIKVLSN